MGKSKALSRVRAYFEEGGFEQDLRRRVAIQSDSQTAEKADQLHLYLDRELGPSLVRLGFEVRILANPKGAGPILLAHRHESDELPTILTYGHGDVVPGHDHQWREGLSPWELKIEGERWYGRGTADNKGQHSINLAALEQVIQAREERLGFNLKAIFETGEERGSVGLREFCEQHAQSLSADLFLASDGPRLNANQPTLFLGSRGTVLFSLEVISREGGLHSGNWGGVMENPAVVLANALACLHWGEPGLSYGERLFGWNTLEVLALDAGNPQKPINAIPPRAQAFCNLRFVLGTQTEDLESTLRQHLDVHGFEQVRIHMGQIMPATRLDLGNKWIALIKEAISKVTDQKIAVIPNLAGTVPNDIFADVLGLPTIWVPHSYPGCSQHAPNEHMLTPIIQEGLDIMTSVFWELGELTKNT
uniref:M20_dimer domain-containing protein n=1 Tax=Steinernema glaseri TaxID=37863 RepID=A0A1I8AK07_9BILA